MRGAKKAAGSVEPSARTPTPVSLRELARRLELSPTTVSLVLNGSPGAESIAAKTKERIVNAARGLNYRPNYLARSLRAQRSFAVGVMIPELSDGYSALVLSGIEEYLLRKHYMFLVTSHHHDESLIEQHPRSLLQRCVEGLIAVDTPLQQKLQLPLVSVSGQRKIPGATKIVLNHDKAAELAISHLMELGHHEIAFFKGQEFSSDTRARWKSIERVCRRMQLAIRPEHVAQLDGVSPSPELGYRAAKQLLEKGHTFTALFAFNDISAIGAMRAFQESGHQVPNRISVIGFDDVYGAAYSIPALTTVRQPLVQMGSLAAEVLLNKIEGNGSAARSDTVLVDPELVIRESTCPPPPASKERKRR